MAQDNSQAAGKVCSTRVIHEEVLRAVGAVMPEEGHLESLADFFKIFGDKTRLRILWALSESAMCVCDLCALLGMKQSAVSRQLGILKQSRLVRYRREGKVVFYSLDDAHIRGVLELGMQHIREPE